MIHGSDKSSFAIGNQMCGISKIKFKSGKHTIKQFGIYAYPFAIESTVQRKMSFTLTLRIGKFTTTLSMQSQKWPGT